MFYEKGIIQNFAKFTEKHLCQSFVFKKETLTLVLSCIFCKFFKNTSFTEHLRTIASDKSQSFQAMAFSSYVCSDTNNFL